MTKKWLLAPLLFALGTGCSDDTSFATQTTATRIAVDKATVLNHTGMTLRQIGQSIAMLTPPSVVGQSPEEIELRLAPAPSTSSTPQACVTMTGPTCDTGKCELTEDYSGCGDEYAGAITRTFERKGEQTTITVHFANYSEKPEGDSAHASFNGTSTFSGTLTSSTHGAGKLQMKGTSTSQHGGAPMPADVTAEVDIAMKGETYTLDGTHTSRYNDTNQTIELTVDNLTFDDTCGGPVSGGTRFGVDAEAADLAFAGCGDATLTIDGKSEKLDATEVAASFPAPEPGKADPAPEPKVLIALSAPSSSILVSVLDVNTGSPRVIGEIAGVCGWPGGLFNAGGRAGVIDPATSRLYVKADLCSGSRVVVFDLLQGKTVDTLGWQEGLKLIGVDDGQLFASIWNGQKQIVRAADLATGKIETIGDLGDLCLWNGITVMDRAQGRFFTYGANLSPACDDPEATETEKFYVFDYENGNLVQSANATSSVLTGVDADGSLIGSRPKGSMQEVLRLSKTTGAGGVLGSLGDLCMWAGSSIVDTELRRLYAIGATCTDETSRLYAFDLTTGTLAYAATNPQVAYQAMVGWAPASQVSGEDRTDELKVPQETPATQEAETYPDLLTTAVWKWTGQVTGTQVEERLAFENDGSGNIQMTWMIDEGVHCIDDYGRSITASGDVAFTPSTLEFTADNGGYWIEWSQTASCSWSMGADQTGSWGVVDWSWGRAGLTVNGKTYVAQ